MSENESPTHGDPAEEVESSGSRPKVIKCPCCDSTIFRNGELKKKGARFIELERAEEQTERLNETVTELRDKLRDRQAEAPASQPESAVLATSAEPEQPRRRKPFLMAS